jgi:hypothetical protein
MSEPGTPNLPRRGGRRCPAILRRGRYASDGTYTQDVLCRCVLDEGHGPLHLGPQGDNWIWRPRSEMEA